MIREFGRLPPFGAVVAIADLVECVHIDRIEAGEFDQRIPWLREHPHTNGPWCWISGEVHRVGPWPWSGGRRLFDIDNPAFDAVALKQEHAVAKAFEAPAAVVE